jgi:hypothetical protein
LSKELCLGHVACQDLGDEEMLGQMLALNLERAEWEA